MHVFRILALGGSICRVLQGSEGLGGSICFVPGQSVCSGFSLSGRPLGFNRGHDSAGSADFLCRKTRGILLGGLQHFRKKYFEVGLRAEYDVKHVIGDGSADHYGGRIVDL